MLKSFRYLLFPFSVLYGSGVRLRNKLFDKNILRSASFNFPVICIGNLAVGGTGKTPMVEYLVQLLKDDFHPATLSRGYKRKTRGFAIADAETTALDIGDEPMQIRLKYPEIVVAVAEERIIAIPQILHEKPDTDVIILDDAFQHRPVKAGLNILLTDHANLFTRDLLLPAGDLRDTRSSSHRADKIIVTKCPPTLSNAQKQELIGEIAPRAHQSVYFTTIDYAEPYHLFTGKPHDGHIFEVILLVCAIANPEPLKKATESMSESYEGIFFRDHHIFTSSDLKEIRKRFDAITARHKIILTTEKDAVRLTKYRDVIADLPIYVMPMRHRFLFDEGPAFDAGVVNFIRQFEKESV